MGAQPILGRDGMMRTTTPPTHPCKIRVSESETAGMAARWIIRSWTVAAPWLAAVSWCAPSLPAQAVESAAAAVAEEYQRNAEGEFLVLPERVAFEPVDYQADPASESIPNPIADVAADAPTSDLDAVLNGDASLSDPAGDPADDLDKLMSMDIDQLANVNVAPVSQTFGELPDSVTLNTGTLTASAAAPISPSTVTHISHEMIEKSGARNINELLDIFVPNLQVIRHHAHYSHIGIRGIISDREDKYLYRVNGRVMNQRMLVGADSERDLPLLRDIDYIDVIRGPGSTTYGPGAIAGVINIQTFNGLTFQGLDANVRQGFEQRMTTTEMRWGKQWGEETGAFLYYGFADQPGANQGDSPVIFGRSGALPNGYPPAVAGEPTPFGVPNDETALFGQPKHKLHFQFTHGTWDFWTRYTRGSYLNPNQLRNLYRPPFGVATATTNLEARPGQGGDYQQLTYFGSKVFELSDIFQVTASASYDFYDYVETRLTTGTPNLFPNREEELYGRVMGQYTPNDDHAFALGYEHSREMFGLDTPLSDLPTRGQRLGFITQPWRTNTGSVFGEYRISQFDPLTVILSGRMDDHTYSDSLFSPRISTMYSLTDVDLLKFNIGQSVRKPGDEEMRAQFLANGSNANEEVIRGSEVRWERRASPNLFFGSSIFHQNHEVVGFSGTIQQSVLLGTFESWGCEFEAVYSEGSNYFTVSHGYVKLLHSSLVDPALIQGISAQPYGFGDDFANWSNNLTKFAFARDVSPNANLSTSLRVYWAFPGARDLAQYNETLAPAYSGSIAQADPGYDKAFEANVYLDAGYQYRWTKHITWRADLYNILGWIDIDLNKRNFINRVSDYRPEAAAAGLSATISY
jgi:outer membrane receptor protein involved in Fe transport